MYQEGRETRGYRGFLPLAARLNLRLPRLFATGSADCLRLPRLYAGGGIMKQLMRHGITLAFAMRLAGRAAEVGRLSHASSATLASAMRPAGRAAEVGRLGVRARNEAAASESHL